MADLENEIRDLESENARLDARLAYRKKAFYSVVTSLHTLQESLKDENAVIMPATGGMNEGPGVGEGGDGIGVNGHDFENENGTLDDLDERDERESEREERWNHGRRGDHVKKDASDIAEVVEVAPVETDVDMSTGSEVKAVEILADKDRKDDMVIDN
jgi:hypothetical protein